MDVPTDLLRLEMIDFVLGNDCRFYTGVALAPRVPGCGKAGDNGAAFAVAASVAAPATAPKREFQKMTAFHDVSPIHGFKSPRSFAVAT